MTTKTAALLKKIFSQGRDILIINVFCGRASFHNYEGQAHPDKIQCRCILSDNFSPDQRLVFHAIRPTRRLM